MKKKKLIVAISFLFTITLVLGISITWHVKTQVEDLFRLNKELQEEGYYMGDFEFQMIGFAHYLAKGEFLEAASKVSDYYTKLANKDGLVKFPEFKDKQDEINFYLNLQNPKTGAFMDDSAPFCTYFSITENILSHLETLSGPDGFKLKYPLKFLDAINTPQKLTSYLNDISYMGNLPAKFPQTTFHFARDILSAATPNDILKRNNLYHFSPEWKLTMLKWMYDFQDPETGLWGPKNKETSKLLKADIHNTYSILKKYRTSNGIDIYPEFPLKHQHALFESTLKQLSVPMPDDDDLAEVHEWNLQQAKAIKMLLTYLWNDASDENKQKTKAIIARFIAISFDKYYVEQDGAFSYYPNASHATVDGMSNMILKRIGALSYARQKKYWGEPAQNTSDSGLHLVNEITMNELGHLINCPDINSWRIYLQDPDFKALTDNVWAVAYPTPTKIQDVVELVPSIKKWLQSSHQSSGNWKSLTDIRKEYASINIRKPIIYKNRVPLQEMNHQLKSSSDVYIVGFDTLQIPRCKIGFSHK